MEQDKQYILSKEVAEKKLRRMALEISERNYNEPELLLIGIKENGMAVAGKIASYMQDCFEGSISVHALSIDKKRPGPIEITPHADCTGRVVVLVDDVANSGKTMLYAVRPLLKNYPQKIQTAALVERTHKSFPIAIDYTGLSVSTGPDEHIYVEVAEKEVNGAWMQTSFRANS